MNVKPFNLNQINGGASRPKDIELQTTQKVGVLGAGMMGQGHVTPRGLSSFPPRGLRRRGGGPDTVCLHVVATLALAVCAVGACGACVTRAGFSGRQRVIELTCTEDNTK